MNRLEEAVELYAQREQEFFRAREKLSNANDEVAGASLLELKDGETRIVGDYEVTRSNDNISISKFT